MAKSKYSWSGHNEFYRMDARGRVTVLKRAPQPKDFAKLVIEAKPSFIERPAGEKKQAKK